MHRHPCDVPTRDPDPPLNGPTLRSSRRALRALTGEPALTSTDTAHPQIMDAACAFGGILYKVLSSSQVVGWLTKIIGRALNTAF